MSDDPIARIEDAIRPLIAGELGIAADVLAPGTKLADLGLSSVKVLRAIAKVVRLYQIELDDDVIFRAETLHDLAQAVAAQVKPSAS